MILYKKDTPYFSITFDLARNEFKVLQRWKYDWNHVPGTSQWTYAETKDFHSKVERLIRSVWGAKLLLKLSPGSILPSNYNASVIKTVFDVSWVLDNSAHWTVAVNKIPAGAYPKTDLRWNTRKVQLDAIDTQPPPYVFGHKCTPVCNHPNSYAAEGVAWENTLHDFPGIMNAGNELKQTHLNFIKQTINGLIPGIKFELSYGH